MPGKRGCPEYNSQKTQPIAHTSTGVPYCVSPTKSSGALYHLVATYSVKFSFWTNILAKPKSHSLTTFCFVIKIFSGLTSLCIHFKLEKKKQVKPSEILN